MPVDEANVRVTVGEMAELRRRCLSTGAAAAAERRTVDPGTCGRIDRV
jgi:hypothetical protein